MPLTNVPAKVAPIDKTTSYFVPAWVTWFQNLFACTKYIKGACWPGGGSPVATPADDVTVECPVSGNITAVIVTTNGGPGSCSIGIYKAPYANFPPTIANTVTGAGPLVLTSVSSYRDTALSGWQTGVNAGDVLLFHINSSSTFTSITIQLEITP